MSALCRSRRELSNAYVLAKFGFDTADNDLTRVRQLDENPIQLRVRFFLGLRLEAFQALRFAGLLFLARGRPVMLPSASRQEPQLKGSLSNLSLIFQPNEQTL